MTRNTRASEREPVEPGHIQPEDRDPVAEIYVLPRSALANKGVRRQLRLRHGHVQILGRDVSTSLILLALTEFIVLMGALYLAGSLGLAGEGAVVSGATADLNITMFVFAAANLLGLLSMGLYRQGISHGLSSLLLRVGAGLVLGAAALAVVFYLMPSLALSRSELLLAFAISGAGLLATRLIGLRFLDQRAFKRRVLVLGAGRNANLMNEIRLRGDRNPFELVGFVPGEGETTQVDAQRVVKPELPLAQYAQLNLVDDVVIALDDARGGFPFDELMACKMSGIDVMEIPDFFEREAGVLKLDTLRPSKMIFSRGFRQSFYRDVAKRQLDIITSLGLLLFAWPFMLLTALGILIESRGRGIDPLPADACRPVRTSLHPAEIPQHGDGCRGRRRRALGAGGRSAHHPLRPLHAQGAAGRTAAAVQRPARRHELRRATAGAPGLRPSAHGTPPHYHHRHWVKPGLTGWAQINYPYGASQKDALEKLQYDLYYVKNQSMSPWICSPSPRPSKSYSWAAAHAECRSLLFSVCLTRPSRRRGPVPARACLCWGGGK
jgi:hypothetical protein